MEEQQVSLYRDRGVYAIVCDRTGKFYLGATARNFMERWEEHVCALDSETHSCARFQQAWWLYGAEAFSFLVLERAPHGREHDHLPQRLEREWFDHLEGQQRTYNRRGAVRVVSRPVNLSLKVEAELRDILAGLADAERITVAALVRRLLVRGVIGETGG